MRKEGRQIHNNDFPEDTFAVEEMCSSIIRKKINYIVDADIKGFFDNMRHEWIIKFVG